MRNRFHRETWLARPPRATVPAALRPWLTDPASLTARIRARCTHFTVQVRVQCLGRLNRDEAHLLGLRRGELAWVREVLLIADGTPVVFARSVLPRAGLRGVWRLFQGMGTRPLGAALFADPRIARQPLACIGLDRRDARYHRIAAGLAGQTLPARAWARRSVFLLRGRPLLVSEAFAPAIFDLPARPLR